MSEYKDKKVIITGGLGFIGSNLARALVKQGANVTLMDSLIPSYGGNLFNIRDIAKDLQVNISDVRDQYAIEYLLKGQDYLFNLAGQTSHLDSMVDPVADISINAVAQLNIVETCRRVNPDIKIVYTSTRQVYGRPRYLPVDEAHPISPVDNNGISKVAGETYHTLYNQVYGIRTCVLRLTNTYGPGMRVKDSRQTFLGIWIRNLLDKKPISVFGSGNQLRDFNFVDDCVSALLLVGKDRRGDGRIFNLGSSEVISLKKLACIITENNSIGEYEVIPFPVERKVIDIGDYYGNIGLIKSEIGWAPAVSVTEGLKRTVEYYQENLAHYV
jgi:UDP-glucose 4-epimerase